MTARLAIAVLLLSGCSHAFTRGPSASMLTDPAVSCTDHHRNTIFDAIVGATAGGSGLAVIILEQKDEPDYTSVPTYAVGIPLIVVGAAFLAASSKGHGKVSRCRKALRRRDTYETTHEPAPATTPEPAPAPVPTTEMAPEPAPAPVR